MPKPGGSWRAEALLGTAAQTFGHCSCNSVIRQLATTTAAAAITTTTTTTITATA